MPDRKTWAQRADDLTRWRQNNPERWPSRTAADPHEASLGRWLSLQRHYANTGTMKTDQEARLNEHAAGWRDTTAPYGERAYQALKEFHREHGHVHVPRDYTSPDGVPLGAWLSHRRSDARVGALAEADRERLEAFGVQWQYRTSPASIETWVERLKAYAAEHGDANPPQSYRCPEGSRLGLWVSAIRRRRRQGELDPTVERDLTALGVDWNPRRTRASQAKPQAERASAA